MKSCLLLILIYATLRINLGPVVAMVWEGKDAVKTGRVMLGATNPADSLPGTALTHRLTLGNETALTQSASTSVDDLTSRHSID